MGYAYYTVIRADGIEIEAGYGVDAVCEHEGCTAQIDRGLDYLCGSTPGAPEDGCGKYFCASHLYYTDPEPTEDDEDVSEPRPWNCQACCDQRDHEVPAGATQS
ncbi:hypothetical protein ACIQWA_36605 [Kitasatospora sp. NPDC098652]|uniref:hypothetical protein n=1 Tax=Kitasatospora sp. NPDC098652 TaxID=3364095 RepID=UPI00381A3F92